jgi:hypothetical protein
MRWDWILAEMIFAFECKADDSWENAFRSGEFDTVWVPIDKDGNEVSGIVAAYVQWHLERGLRSLPLVDRQAT